MFAMPIHHYSRQPCDARITQTHLELHDNALHRATSTDENGSAHELRIMLTKVGGEEEEEGQ